MDDLPTFRTIVTAYRFVLSHYLTILRLVWFPLVMVGVVDYFLNTFVLVPLVPGRQISQSAAATVVLIFALQVVAWVLAAMPIHRLVLFDDRKLGVLTLPKLGRSEFLFAPTCVLLWVTPTALVIFVAMEMQSVGQPISSLFPLAVMAVILFGSFVIYLIIRLVLIYPIFLVDGSFDWRQSWRLTRGHTRRLFWLILLGILPLSIVFAPIEQVIQYAMVDRSSAAAMTQSMRNALPYELVLQSVYAALALAVGVALICFAYKSAKGIPADAIVQRAGA